MQGFKNVCNNNLNNKQKLGNLTVKTLNGSDGDYLTGITSNIQNQITNLNMSSTTISGDGYFSKIGNNVFLNGGNFAINTYLATNAYALSISGNIFCNSRLILVNKANNSCTLSVGDGNQHDPGAAYGCVNISRPANDVLRAHLAFIRAANYVWQFSYINNSNRFGIFNFNYNSSSGLSPTMTWSNNNCVGINTNNPVYNLDIVGNAHLTTGLYIDNNQNIYGKTTGGTYENCIIPRNNFNDTIIYYNVLGNLYIKNVNTNVIKCTKNNNVNIGVTEGTHKFNVDGNIFSFANVLGNNIDANNKYDIENIKNDIITTNTNLSITDYNLAVLQQNYDNKTNMMVNDSDYGVVYFTNYNISANNITTIENNINTLFGTLQGVVNDGIGLITFDGYDISCNNIYNKSQIDTKFSAYYTGVYSDTKYYTKTYIDNLIALYYSKALIDLNFYNKTYITTNYYNKTYINTLFDSIIFYVNNIYEVYDDPANVIINKTISGYALDFYLKTGSAGSNGSNGSDGAAGPKGDTGPRGPKGDSSSSGDAMGIISLIGGVFGLTAMTVGLISTQAQIAALVLKTSSLNYLGVVTTITGDTNITAPLTISLNSQGFINNTSGIQYNINSEEVNITGVVETNITSNSLNIETTNANIASSDNLNISGNDVIVKGYNIITLDANEINIKASNINIFGTLKYFDFMDIATNNFKSTGGNLNQIDNEINPFYMDAFNYESVIPFT